MAPKLSTNTALDDVVGALTAVNFSLGDVDFSRAYTHHKHARTGKRGDMAEVYVRQWIEAASANQGLDAKLYDARGHRLNGSHCLSLFPSTGFVVSQRVEGFAKEDSWYDVTHARLDRHSYDVLFMTGSTYFVVEVKATVPQRGFVSEVLPRALHYAEMLSDNPRPYEGDAQITKDMHFGGMIVAFPYVRNPAGRRRKIESVANADGMQMVRCLDLGCTPDELATSSDNLRYFSKTYRKHHGILAYRPATERAA